jgi:hypothetical protein
MKKSIFTLFLIILFPLTNLSSQSKSNLKPAKRKTSVSIVGEKFYINGKPTLKNRTWRGYNVEGLLPNSRMVQGIFDDLNPETIPNWNYPDTKTWDPNRNTQEFIQAMEQWRKHGLLSFTICLQGGSPFGYSSKQPWHNSAIEANGDLRPDFRARLEKILDKADELGMAPIVSIFYFGQDQRLDGDDAAKKAVKNVINWLFDKNYSNVLIEVGNESDNRGYDIPILKADRIHELIVLAKSIERNGKRFLVTTSFCGGVIPPSETVKVSDFILLHGNGVHHPDKIVTMIRETRKVEGYKPMPIVFNEDDHFDFDKPWNNFVAATSEYASWGYFDYRMKNEGFDEGYQSVPVNWGISSERKKGFFQMVKEMSGLK